MYEPTFRIRSDGIPILSRQEIESIAEHFVADFRVCALHNPEPMDIDSFAECYLGLTVDYQYLSHNGVYLGMIVFSDTDRVPVFDPLTNRAEYISADAGTVIVDCRLVDDFRQERRYRFTMGHESSHAILHMRHASDDPYRQSAPGPYRTPLIQCRTDPGMSTGHTGSAMWTAHDFMEWQANAMASSLLMPRPAVRHLYESLSGGYRNRHCPAGAAAKEMSEVFDVSHEAALYRLRDLGLISPDELKKHLYGSRFPRC